ncbi:MAG: FkbM family methyltransferase [Deltaproteobacteria bacterium]|jgi:FkbM family methyltransferase|nr:FkbM family methyltransferase [Deltaproteobacteria bacterium]
MISNFVDVFGEWSEMELAMFRDLLKEDSNVLEVGSNIGMHTVALSRMVPKGRVIAFEPQRVIHQVLSANCALNQCTNVFAEHFAVGNHTGEVDIPVCNYTEDWNYGSYSIVEGYSAEGSFQGDQWREKVRITRLDDHMRIRDLDAIRLMKIDVEGLECEVLEGAKETIQKHRPFLFIENNNQEYGDQLIAKIANLGYKSYWYCTERFHAKNFNGQETKFEGGDFNMLCFPAEMGINPGRLMEAKEFSDLLDGKVSYITRDVYPAI